MVKKGETILAEKPFAFVLNTSSKTERCDYCFAAGVLKKCSRCQYVYYCSKNCQRSAWPLHKLECTNLKKISPKMLPESAHLLIRIMLKLQIIEEQGYLSDKKKSRTFDDLMSHLPEVQNDKRRMEHLTTLLMVLRSFFGEHDVPDDYTVSELFGKMCINSFNILNNDMNSIGVAVYLDASRIDHSCKPTTVAVFEGTTLYIRSIENLPDSDWNLIRISYIDVLNTAAQRKQELQSMYYFLCDCPRCCSSEEDESMNSMKCPNSSCPGYIPVSENVTKFMCSACQSEATAESVLHYNEVAQLSDYHIQSMKSKDMAYLDVCQVTLSKQEGILHDFNVRKIKTLDLAFEASINLQLWDKALKFGTELLPGFKKYYGQYHPLVGHLCMKLMKLELLKDDTREAKSLYFQANEILSVTHGTSHSLYATLQDLFGSSI